MCKRGSIILALPLFLWGCAPSISCNKIDNPTFGERLAVSHEITKDGPASQIWIERYTGILEVCGFNSM